MPILNIILVDEERTDSSSCTLNTTVEVEYRISHLRMWLSLDEKQIPIHSYLPTQQPHSPPSQDSPHLHILMPIPNIIRTCNSLPVTIFLLIPQPPKWTGRIHTTLLYQCHQGLIILRIPQTQTLIEHHTPRKVILLPRHSRQSQRLRAEVEVRHLMHKHILLIQADHIPEPDEGVGIPIDAETCRRRSLPWN